MRTLVTPHFRVHHLRALDSLARRTAVLAEAAYAQFAAELAQPKLPIDLLVTDNVDYSNGFAQVFPTPRVVIYAVPPVAAMELRYSGDWLRMVVTHEIAHIFHIDRARGLWTLGRWVFGRAPVLFPNIYTPSWVKEGLAVHYETRFTGLGRAASTEFPNTATAAARDSLLLPPSRWSAATTRWPRGGTAYTYGSQLMDKLSRMSPEKIAPGDSRTPMRRYIDQTASTIIPYVLGYNARAAFGTGFNEAWKVWRDSVVRAASVAPNTRTISEPSWVSPDGFAAAAPRWLTADSLTWTSSNGREVAGQFIAAVGGAPHRVAWRNALDAHSRVGDVTTFAQTDFRDPYTYRSDLYRERAGNVTRLTHEARLTMADARADGRIVAVQLGAGTANIVVVTPGSALSPDGSLIDPSATPTITTLARSDAHTLYTDPRWSPRGDRIAAVQMLVDGTQRIVVLDTLGRLQHVAAGGRGVFGSPSFTPDGASLVYATDRSGRMQLERATMLAANDTVSWRSAHVGAQPTSIARVRQVSALPTGAYAPTVSPDGRRVVALVPRADGLHVAVLPLDTIGVAVQATWYANRDTVPLPRVDVSTFVNAPSGRYQSVRQLLPRYWLPSVGEGRDGRATYGLMSNGSDILGRNSWEGSILVEPTRREFEGALAWRWARLGVPVVDVSTSQDWDATFRVVDTANTTLGLVARRRRFATAQATFSVPRVRWSFSSSVGAQYEWRDFTSDVDSVLGEPNSLLRRGTRYPSLFLSTSIATTRRALRGISVEEGAAFTTNTAYRWREDAPSLGSWRTVLTGRAYLPLDLPGYSRHVIGTRVIAGIADTKTASEFTIGGTSGVLTELFPGVNVGDPSRAFPVRGVAPGTQRGIRAIGGTVEYKAPLVMFSHAPGPFTLFADRLSISVFSDAARAWCPDVLVRANSVLCQRRSERDGVIAAVGAELVADMAISYDAPYRLRIGAAAPYIAPSGVPRKGAFYVTLGGYF